MEQMTEQLFRSGTFALVTCVVAATFFVRRIVENVWPGLRHSVRRAPYRTKMQLWWNSVILYAIPVSFGALSGLSRSRWLFGGIDTLGGRLMFGVSIGWLSSFLYKVFSKLVLKWTGVDLPGDRDHSTNVDVPDPAGRQDSPNP